MKNNYTTGRYHSLEYFAKFATDKIINIYTNYLFSHLHVNRLETTTKREKKNATSTGIQTQHLQICAKRLAWYTNKTTSLKRELEF